MSSSNATFNGRRRVPPPVNETIKSYAPGSPERASLKARLKTMAAETVDMPMINGMSIFSAAIVFKRALSDARSGEPGA